MTTHRNLSDADKKAIVKAYNSGAKLREIEERFEVPRATVYWVLEQADVTPDRLQRGARLRGNDQQLVALYELVTAQDARIQELEDEVRRLQKKGGGRS